MLAVDLLRSVETRLSSPERWTQGESARDVTGSAVGAQSPMATCWCLLGALHADPDVDSSVIGAAYMRLLDACDSESIVDFNDATDHPTLMKAIQAAIRSTE